MAQLLHPYKISQSPLLSRDVDRRFLLSILHRQESYRRVFIIAPRGIGKKVLVEETLRELSASNELKSMVKLDPFRITTENLFDLFYSGESIPDFPELKETMLVIIEDFHHFLHSVLSLTEKQVMFGAIMNWLFGGKHGLIATITPDIFQELAQRNHFWFSHVTSYYLKPLSPLYIRKVLLLWRKRYEQKYNVEIPLRLVDEIIEFGSALIKSPSFPQCGIELLEAVSSAAVVKSFDEASTGSGPVLVSSADLYEQLSGLLRIPVGNYLGIDPKKVLKLQKLINDEIFGQDKAIVSLVRSVQQSLLGAKEPGHERPMGIFLFMGPTGVGKTETARALSRHLFGEDQSLLINMAEFQDPIEGIHRLRGEALASQIKENPFSVVILDEIEKSSHRVREFFLNVFDFGTFRDLKEQEIDATNTFFIMTSNVGADLFEQTHGILPESFSDHDYKIKKLELLDALKKEDFRPEFINRIDEIILFKPLSRTDISQIISSSLQVFAQSLHEAEEKDVIIDEGIPPILSRGCDLNFGARDARRVLRKNIYSRILKTSEYFQSSRIEIKRSMSLRSLDDINLAVVSFKPKDGIDLILSMFDDSYSIKLNRFNSVTDFARMLSSYRFDIIILHSSLEPEGKGKSGLQETLDHLKRQDHSASLYMVIDSFQPLSLFKKYMEQGVRGLLRLSELEEWLKGMVLEMRQRRSMSQSVDFNYEELHWSLTFSAKDKSLQLVLEKLDER